MQVPKQTSPPGQPVAKHPMSAYGKQCVLVEKSQARPSAQNPPGSESQIARRPAD
jgi:hypothetical protein